MIGVDTTPGDNAKAKSSFPWSFRLISLGKYKVQIWSLAEHAS